MFFPLIWTYLKTPVWLINSLKTILLVVTIVVDACWLEPIPLLIHGYTVSIVFLQSVLEPDPAPLIYRWQNGALVPASPHRVSIQASKRVYIAPWWPLWKRSKCVGTKPTCFFLPCRYQEVIWSYPFILLAYGTWKHIVSMMKAKCTSTSLQQRDWENYSDSRRHFWCANGCGNQPSTR